LKRGHSVVGIARNPEKVNIKGAEIVQGTPYDYDTVKKAIAGCGAVISTLSSFPNTQGLFSKVKTPLDVMSVSMKNVVKAMKEEGISRVILMTALGVGDTAHLMPGFFSFLVKISNIKYAYQDHDRQEKVLEESGLDWTVLRPVYLNDKKEDLSIQTLINGEGGLKSSITRAAVANLMIDCIEKGLYSKQKPGISNA
jgi:putative NADH-flavin reductase